MALSSPGVEVKVIDESFYTPAAPGTVPLIVVATAENKANSGASGTAPGTLKANAGEVYLVTSQRDLGDTFGDPIFKTDASNNPVHAGEQNEYGLQAAYSLLGVSNRAFVVRADLDLAQLDASATEPDATPANGTHWLDTANSKFGIFEWNGAAITTSGGQKFVNKIPRVITDPTKVDGSGAPLASVGAIGDYAVVMVEDAAADNPALTTLHPGTVWYRSRGIAVGQEAGQWVQVGSDEWFKSWPTVSSKVVTVAPTDGHTFTINGTTITAGTTLTSIRDDINDKMDGTGISAAVVNSNKLEIYSDGQLDGDATDADDSNAIIILNGTGALIGPTGVLGITAGTYYAPRLQIKPHTQVPQYKSSATYPRPTGSVWIKTTEPNLGAQLSVKRWNETTSAWEAVTAPVYTSGQEAIYGLDTAGGGANLASGQVYAQANMTEQDGSDGTPRLADVKLWIRGATGATVIQSAKIGATGIAGATLRSFTLAESLVGETALDTAKTISWTPTQDATDADLLATAINSAGFTNIEAEVDAQNRVLIKHKLGGDFRMAEGTGTPLVDYGFAARNYEPSSGTFGQGTAFLTAAPSGDATNDFIASNWVPLVYVASTDAPSRIPADGTLWYSSVIDEVDIMIHNGTTWVGYQTVFPTTDPEGPQVAATAPETQSDGTDLVTGDLWISTADMENFPQVYKYNADLEEIYPTTKCWVLVDKTDQSSEDGMLFADARYNTSGVNSYEAGTIASLLTSNYLDPDAPDPALYPAGMLLWNLRRSGYNVKAFARDSIDLTSTNPRANNASMATYYEHRWVTVSANQADGSGSFGRKAQRAVVVQALQATVNSNQGIRDEDSRIFNLIACPGYPELIGEMISLNYDRGLTAFVVADTPARLTPDATSLLAWGNNDNGALEDNDIGAASFDEYMGMFYPWGYSSDNFGNNVAVPPSHMILRTIALNDQVAYPWFAPAGVRRGGITNATAVGYVTSEGEFKSVALNNGQRDTLYETKVNPITFFTGTGLVNYGQKTRARAASALDRINVARLVIYLRRQLSILAKPYIFEPNDKITRDEVKGAVEALLLELVGQRALYDYLVVCDESNNTPNRIDRNELWIDIAIEPVKAVEFIYIPLRLKNTGEIAGL